MWRFRTFIQRRPRVELRIEVRTRSFSLLTKTENCGPRGAVLGLVRVEARSADRQIREAGDYVDFWKVGKLNHNKAVEQSALGPKFRDGVTAQPEHCGCNYYIKEVLRKAS